MFSRKTYHQVISPCKSHHVRNTLYCVFVKWNVIKKKTKTDIRNLERVTYFTVLNIFPTLFICVTIKT